MGKVRNLLSKIKTKIRKIEWSKKFCSLIALGFGVYGIWCGIQYYRLCEIALECEAVAPDPTLAVTCVTTVIASLVSYLLYQAGLKNSRNKYGIDADGQPFRLREEDPTENEDNPQDSNG
jgi:hypothetical protein